MRNWYKSHNCKGTKGRCEQIINRLKFLLVKSKQPLLLTKHAKEQKNIKTKRAVTIKTTTKMKSDNIYSKSKEMVNKP